MLPACSRERDDAFLRKVQAPGEKWVVLVDPRGEPGLVIDGDGFLRDALLGAEFTSTEHCHRPIVIRNPATRLGSALRRFPVEAAGPEDDVIDRVLILMWTPGERRVLTGADILGRLLRGIATRDAADARAAR